MELGAMNTQIRIIKYEIKCTAKKCQVFEEKERTNNLG